MEFGRAMGNDEPVTPVFPNSDYCTGIAGVIAIIEALIRRSEKGGSYVIDVALNYYSQWLVNSCGVYTDDVWQRVWNANGRRSFRHYHNMLYSIPLVLGMIRANSEEKLFRPEFFEDREVKHLGTSIRAVKPILQFPEGKVELGFNVGTRTNGVDQPR
ncbi:hypothetical protein LTR16_000023 [Cryomyces antarcticus]|uniref:Uncharacterized protein n=1 Tax=Cryomyces antarcticus TaxID=329879 RepID=A0ABR0KUZ9_9PEZI|nr:hypothetical protein LTR16_000023 [Cryomyces antarcticus]